jgi:hypothetical protein
MAPSGISSSRSSQREEYDEVQIEFRLLPSIQSTFSSENSILESEEGDSDDDLSQQATTQEIPRNLSAKSSLKYKAKQHRQLVHRYRDNHAKEKLPSIREPPGMARGLPLKHERALAVNPSLSPPRRHRPPTLETIHEAESLSKSSSTTSSTMESVVMVVTEPRGSSHVLVLEAESAVEAVSIRSAEQRPSEQDESELSYTERLLLQEDLSLATNNSSREEETNWDDEEEPSRINRSTVSRHRSRLWGRKSGWHRNTRFSSSSRDRNDIRANSDPGVASIRFAVPFGSSSSCATGPIPLEEFVARSEEEASASELIRQPSNETERESFSVTETKYLPLRHRRAGSCGGQSAVSEYDLVSESSTISRRIESDLSHFLSRGRSNISATTYASEEDEYRDLYRSFDLESARSTSSSWTSHLSSFGKPLNIPVSQEFRDMADEFTKNPTVLMKWLNPKCQK